MAIQNEPGRVVVTGMGALTPLGHSPDEFWEGLMVGRSGAAPITHFDAEHFATKFACELKGFDPLNYFEPREARKMDPFAQYGMAAAIQAVEDSGLNPDRMTQDQRDRIAVIIGSGIGGIQVFHEQTAAYIDKGPRRISPFFIPKLIPDIVSGHISIRYKFRGPNYCVVSACATGNNNIGDAYMMLQCGMIDAALCGGAEAAVSELGIGGFNALRALSTRNDDPATASRPFDKTRDGFVLGEGAGVLVIETLKHAQERGARIYAEIIGIGMSGDANHITAPDPEGTGATLAMRNMLTDARLHPEDVDYLNMHGTSTPLGDTAETKSIKAVFGSHAYKMSLSSTKSMTGHLLGAAGAVEAIATIQAICNDRVPPTINFVHPDLDCDLDYTFNQPKNRPVSVAVSNAFGFGGHNTSIAFREFIA
ncbi:MAG: beta-ketoacyl-ACP synthase II [Bacteroidetes bacterium]|nr:beta-ketoacyl-ACP synthase II [Bacteroidota bacterium]MCY4205197.1 beta-ketoacyl-ACP synthase II [Bacteroidota bacterium]